MRLKSIFKSARQQPASSKQLVYVCSTSRHQHDLLLIHMFLCMSIKHVSPLVRTQLFFSMWEKFVYELVLFTTRSEE